MYLWEVLPHESGLALAQFIRQRLKGAFSLRCLKRQIEHNCCLVNGKVERFASTRMTVGDSVVFRREGVVKKKLFGFETKRILYEDEVLLCYDKPFGIPTVEKGLDRLLLTHHPDLRPVHRLDKDTSGVVLFAKTDETALLIEEQFRTRRILKCYHALVDGVPREAAGEVANYLGKVHAYDGQSIWGACEGGRFARTLWKLVKKGKQASLLQCEPLTGRTHQIRAHLSGIGHPILGDYQYGRTFRTSYKPFRHLLHAVSLGFLHPLTQKRIDIKALYPSDFLAACEALGISIHDQTRSHR